MSFLMSSGNQPLIADGINITTSVNTLVIPKVWGQNIVAGNLVWSPGSSFQYHDESGGKGFGGKGQDQSYYSADIILALAQSKIDSIKWVYTGTTINNGAYWLSDKGVTLFQGTLTQGAWSYLESTYPNQVLYYPGIAYLAAEGFNLGGSASPPNNNFVFVGDETFWPSYGGGADPALVINDVLNGSIAEGCGFPGLNVDLTTLLSASTGSPTNNASLQAYCYANSFAISPVLDTQERAGSILDRWAQILNCQIGFWDGALKFIPYGDTALTANGITYTPDLTIALSLDEDDFVTGDNEEPVKIGRVDPVDVKNVVRVECNNIANRYAPLPVEKIDEQNVAQSGGIRRILPNIRAREIISPTTMGALVAQLILQRQQWIRNSFTWKLSWALGCMITPGDLVELTSPDTGLTSYVVRVTKCAADEQGIVTVTAEDFPQGIATAQTYAASAPSGTGLNSGIDADPVNTPILFEPTYAMLIGTGQPGLPAISAAVSGGAGGEADPNWGGAYVWIALASGGPYEPFGIINGAARQGVLTASLASYTGTNPDSTDTLSVNLNESNGSLSSYPSAAAAAGASLCIVDGELIAYTTATLTSIQFGVSEAWTVPASPGPYTILVNFFGANYVADSGVSYTGGAALTKVGANPTAGQYTEDGTGNYGFAAGDAGAAITIAYQRNGPGYNLTGLYRGLYGSPPNAHAAGAAFAMIDHDTAIFSQPLPPQYVGVPLWLKFQSFNIWGQGVQDISTCTPYEYIPTGVGFLSGLVLYNTAGAPMVNTSGVVMDAA